MTEEKWIRRLKPTQCAIIDVYGMRDHNRGGKSTLKSPGVEIVDNKHSHLISMRADFACADALGVEWQRDHLTPKLRRTMMRYLPRTVGGTHNVKTHEEDPPHLPIILVRSYPESGLWVVEMEGWEYGHAIRKYPNHILSSVEHPVYQYSPGMKIRPMEELRDLLHG